MNQDANNNTPATSATPTTSASTSITYPSIPQIVLKSYSGDANPSFGPWSSRSMDTTPFNNRSIPEPSFLETQKFTIPQPPKPIVRPEFEATHSYPYLQNINSRNFSSYGPISVPQSQNTFTSTHGFTFRPTYMNGCTQYQPTLPLMETMKRSPSIPLPQVNKIPSSVSDHSFSTPREYPVRQEYRLNSSTTMPNIGHLTAIKRNVSLNNSLTSQATVDMLAADKPPAKKKKNYHPSREAIQKAISAGFTREVNKIESENGDVKRNVIYKAPDGTQLFKKQDVKNYLNVHPEIDLKNENFSFDTRLSMNPKKNKEIPLDKTFSVVPSPNSVTTIKTQPPKLSATVVRTSEAHAPKVIKKPEEVKKMLPAKKRKLITKHFKKITDDTKYYEGLPSASYRRKLSSFPKIDMTFTLDTKPVLIEESCKTFDNLLVVLEFLSHFSKQLKITSNITNLTDLTNVLTIEDIEKSEFCNLFYQLLFLLITNNGYAHDLQHYYMLDNIFALNWNWLLIHEIFRHYLDNKTRNMFNLQILDNSFYHESWKELLSYLSSNQFIYSSTPILKAFILRLLIDQNASLSSFSAIINEYVETISKCKREKYHVETKIRQVKYRLNSSTQKNGVKTEDPVQATNGENVQDEAADINGRDLHQSSLSQDDLENLEHERDSLRKTIYQTNSTIRSAHLGWDRFDREYQYCENQKTVLVEGLANQKGIAQYKFAFSSSLWFKPRIPNTCKVSDLLCISSHFNEKIGLDYDTFEFESYKTYIVDTEKSVNTVQHQELVNEAAKNQGILNLLIYHPKLIKSISEDDFLAFIDTFSKNLSKFKKRSSFDNEYGQGWWEISDRSMLGELSKCLSQKGYKEQNLLKSINRCLESLSCVPEKTDQTVEKVNHSINVNYMSSTNVSGQDLFTKAKSLIISELKVVFNIMDTYLKKSNPQIGLIFEEQGNRYLNLPDDDFKAIGKGLVDLYLQNCDKRVDKNWFLKWNESFVTVVNLGTAYAFCLSLKIKIDPNSKMCRICKSVDESQTIHECHICQLSAHEKCLELKLMCYGCYVDYIDKSNRICKKCSVRQGRTMSCATCNEYFHQKCVTNKPKNKNDPLICDACVNAAKEPTFKTYTRPEISFRNLSFKAHSSKCSNIIKKIKENKDSEPFLEPVDRTVPDYYEIIKKPMNLNKIAAKARTNKYKTITQFYNDVIQIFENCYMFNDEKSKIAKCGVRLQKLFLKEWNIFTSSLK